MTVARHQLLGGAQAGAGIGLLSSPRAALEALAAPNTTFGRVVARVLGMRLLVQGAAVGLSGSPTAIEAGGVVDALHGLSMLVVAVRYPRWRRAAAVNAVCAGGAVLASRYAVARRQR